MVEVDMVEATEIVVDMGIAVDMEITVAMEIVMAMEIVVDMEIVMDRVEVDTKVKDTIEEEQVRTEWEMEEDNHKRHKEEDII